MDRRAGNGKPYGRCLALAGSAVEQWAACEALLDRNGIHLGGDDSLRHWLVVFEALLRERMDEEQAELFDADLDAASDYAPDPDEKRDLMIAWGGEAS